MDQRTGIWRIGWLVGAGGKKVLLRMVGSIRYVGRVVIEKNFQNVRRGLLAWGSWETRHRGRWSGNTGTTTALWRKIGNLKRFWLILFSSFTVRNKTNKPSKIKVFFVKNKGKFDGENLEKRHIGIKLANLIQHYSLDFECHKFEVYQPQDGNPWNRPANEGSQPAPRGEGGFPWGNESQDVFQEYRTIF